MPFQGSAGPGDQWMVSGAFEINERKQTICTVFFL
jgi:hypothetical protein